MVEDVVVESKVVAGDDVDAGILLDLPVGQTQTLALREEVLLAQLSTPVCFVGLLQVTQHAHARETEDCGVDHLECC